MWAYIMMAAGVVLVILLLWVMQPYKNWKKNFDARQYEPVTITDRKRKVRSMAEYKEISKEVELSLVVPSYNEEARLPVMLKQTASHLKAIKISYEIIIANDGSKDGTSKVALQTADDLDLNLVVLQYPKNRGKGGAVRAGMAVSNGKYALMVDADGATTFSEIDKVKAKLQQLVKSSGHPLAMVVGSRRHLEEQQQSKVQRKWYRKLISGIFKLVITILLGIKTKDTQCGFKLFTRESASILFQTLHIQRFAFDVQLFFLCNHHNISTAQVPVEWRDIDGSKLNILDASVNMFRDVLMIRIYYWMGLWKVGDRVEVK